MKKFLLLLLLMTGMAKAQNLTIADANFKSGLIGAGVDTNSDGIIQVSEALARTELNINNSNIQSVAGIESFVNLESLSLPGNLIETIDVSKLVKLKQLNLEGNKLSNLDVAALINLTDLSCSRNTLSTINVLNLSNLTYLSCENNTLTDIKINGLSGLKNVYCRYNNLSTINLSGLSSLIVLATDHNPSLASLDLSALSNLQILDIGDCNFSSIDLNNNTNLTQLYCSHNQLYNLDVTKLSKLEDLWMRGNKIYSMNLRGNPMLNWFMCDNTNEPSAYKLYDIYFGDNKNLQFLYINSNNLQELDLSKLERLSQLNCTDNQLKRLNIKNGSNEATLNFGSNPLEFICVDDAQIDNVQNLLTQNGQNGCVVNSYCSFVPGGGYNTIYGSINFDKNNDGCDANDLPLKNIRMNLNDGTNTGTTFNSVNGGALFYTNAGDFTVTPVLENPSYFNVNATANTFNFAAASGLSQTTSFCIAPNGTHHDVEVVMLPMTIARPGFEAVYRLVYKNKGTQVASGTLNFSYDEAVLDYVSASLTSNALTSGAASWNFIDLLPFETRVIDVTLRVNTPTATPAVNNGDILVLNAAIAINGVADEMQADNQFVYNQIVVNSYDPNEVECLEGEKLPTSKVGDYLHYVIHFENTGTADAINVVLKDVIDEAKFDMSSLQVIESSATAYTRINNNVAEFIFQNINLKSDGGRGHILLKVKSKSNLVADDTVSQKANIYFDYNFPIETNDETTTFAALGVNENELDQTVKVYPNPVVNEVQISAQSNIRSVQVYDIQGRLLQVQTGGEMNAVLDLSTQNQGVYFLKITTDSGSKIERIIKR
jgi:uncharacterized repeat protein (TIGR01451 family)